MQMFSAAGFLHRHTVMAAERVTQEDNKASPGILQEGSGPPGGQDNLAILPETENVEGNHSNNSHGLHSNTDVCTKDANGVGSSSSTSNTGSPGHVQFGHVAEGVADGGGGLEEPGGADGEADGEGGKDDGTRRYLCNPRAFLKELGQLGQLAWPVVMTQILHYTIGTAAIIFAGHRGKTELDVVALSTSMLSATAIAVANGLSGYCDTIFAQVYGSQDRTKLGVVLQKCLVIITLGICPSLALHINLHPILLLMGHDHHVSRLSEEYLVLHIPGTIAFFIYIVFSKYVQNQNKERPILVIAILANVLNVVLHAIFFIWLKTGIWGSSLSQCLSYIFLMVLTIVYIKVSGIYKETWHGWTSECFLAWGLYGKLGVYSLMQHCIEIWAFDLGIILSGAISLQMLAAQSIAYQYVLILYTIAWGVGLAGGIRVGHYLGANDPKSARLSCIVSLIVAGSLGTFFLVLVLSLRLQLPLLFTDDSEIVALVASVLPFIAAEEVFDFLGGTMNGILRGCGRQSVGTAITIPAFAFVLFCGIPIMFKTSLNIKGFWIAVLIALFFQSAIGTFFLCHMNWENEAAKAQARVKASGGEDEDSQGNIQKEKGGYDNEINLELNEFKKPSDIQSEKEEEAKETDSVVFTKTVVFFRVLAFSLSVGCLIVGIIVRYTIHIPIEVNAHTNVSLLILNSTAMSEL